MVYQPFFLAITDHSRAIAASAAEEVAVADGQGTFWAKSTNGVIDTRR